MASHRRIADDQLDELFGGLTAISLQGAKGVGETATAQRRAATVLSLDRPGQRETLSGDIEVKLAEAVTDTDVRHLNWLGEQLGERLADRVIVTTGERAYRRRDGVAVVPLALLGP